MKLILNNNQSILKIDIPKIERTVKATLLSEGRDTDCEISLTLCGDETIQDLNKRYRGMDKPTNVLSFVMGDGDFTEFSGNLLGDIIISTQTVKTQAVEWDVSFEKHFHFLLIHGVLHLLGYEHGDEEEYEAMEQKTDNVLKELGF